MFAQISKSFKFLKELQLLHSLISLNQGIIFLAHQYFLKSCHDNFKNVLLYLLPHSGIYAVNVCKIKRTENYISKVTLSDSWFMLFFFFFYFLFYFSFSSRARLSVDQGLSNRQTYKLLNVFLPGWFSRAVLRFNSSQAVNVFASWKKSEFFVLRGWVLVGWFCASFYEYVSFLISRYNVSSN